LPPDIFEVTVNTGLMLQALIRQMSNARLGTHKAKTRSEKRGGGAKPWRQKGTGRARHGSRRSPIWVGGGKAHGPVVRGHGKRMPRQMRQAALRSALSEKAASDQIVVVDELKMIEPKTKKMEEILMVLVPNAASSLVVLPDTNDVVEKSVRNLSWASTLRASYLNIRDLIGHDALVLPLASLEAIRSHLGRQV
ncbi:MAG: 50S ribosomal protein L4, partial [Anaerolineales bacterium]|nr:50S ribosomal protein L4 [Anaerolineales bacterium]